MCGANSNEIAIARREEKTTTRIPYSCDDECSSISDDPAIVAGLQRWCLDVSEWDELSPEQVMIYDTDTIVCSSICRCYDIGATLSSPFYVRMTYGQ